MDRAQVELSPDGQILVDVSKLYQWPKANPASSTMMVHILTDLGYLEQACVRG